MQKVKPSSFYLLEGYKALGTLFWVECFDVSVKDNIAKRESLENDLKKILVTFEETFSRFKEGSLTRILSKGEKVENNKELLMMISFGEKLSKETEGLFSLFIADDLIRKGYGEVSFLIKEDSDNKKNHFIIEDGTVRLFVASGIDFGGIGKGYVIDLLASHLQEEMVKYFLINGGGDMYMTSDNEEPLTVYLEHPLEEEVFLGKIMLKNKGFAGSSSFKRSWQKDGEEKNHFVTQGNEVWGASFIVAENALIADSLATCVLLQLPSTSKQELLASTYGASFLLMSEENVISSKNFPPLVPVS